MLLLILDLLVAIIIGAIVNGVLQRNTAVDNGLCLLIGFVVGVLVFLSHPITYFATV
jgi:hypothetical protein